MRSATDRLATSALAALGAQAFSYNANDEIGGDTFDANGNTTASGGHTFAYDFENRLVSKDGDAVTVPTIAMATASPRPSAA